MHNAGYQLDYSGKWHVGRNISPWETGWKNSYSKAEGKPAHWPDHFVPGQSKSDRKWAKAKAELGQRGHRRPGEILRPGWENVQLYKTLDTSGSEGFEVGGPDYRAIHVGTEKMQRLADTAWNSAMRRIRRAICFSEAPVSLAFPHISSANFEHGRNLGTLTSKIR